MKTKLNYKFLMLIALAMATFSTGCIHAVAVKSESDCQVNFAHSSLRAQRSACMAGVHFSEAIATRYGNSQVDFFVIDKTAAVNLACQRCFDEYGDLNHLYRACLKGVQLVAENLADIASN